MREPIERVAAACPFSKFKDDRHEWRLLMHQDLIVKISEAYYALRQCEACKLTVLLAECGGGYSDAPKNEDRIIFAFYPANAPKEPS